MPTPVRVAVTGAAGQIGYSLLFRIASGQLLGPDQPVILQLLEVTPALGALEGVAMELDDCAFPLLAGSRAQRRRRRRLRRRRLRAARRRDAAQAGHGAQRPARRPTARSSPLRARRSRAARAATCKVLVVGNPANTNALITLHNAPDIDPAPDHGDDAARPQPRREPARAARRRAGLERAAHDHLGQPLDHAVPRPLPLRGRRQERLRARRRPRLGRGDVHPDGREARRGGHRGTRLLVGGLGRERGDRPHARLGARHRRTATGSAWPSSPTAPTACPRV